MSKHSRQSFFALLTVALLGISYPLFGTSNNWAQVSSKQGNHLVYAQIIVPFIPQQSKSAQVEKTNPSSEKKQEKGKKSDAEKKQELPWTVTVATLGVVVLLYLVILQFCPLLLLWLPAKLRIPQIGMLEEFELSLGFLIWLKYHPRVLDAWVDKHIYTFENNFLETPTVADRKDYVSLPVLLKKYEIDELTAETLKNHKIDELTAETLREMFCQENRVRLLIWGDAGSGKTTIACQIAKWAMEKDKSKRLNTHLMLPVLIEEELDLQQGEGMKPLMESIVRDIEELIDTEQTIVDELLVEQLLRKRRILLIVDRLSEMSEQSYKKINPNIREFPANALVVTSRIDEKFKGIDSKIETLRFDGGKLAYFIKQYLKKCQKWNLFEDEQEEFLQECAQLARIVGDQQTITVLLAKLYAERMINAKNNLRGTTRSPDNIPDLIIDHLEKLNRQKERDTRSEYPNVKKDAKVIAWKCLEDDYRPKPVQRESVVAALRENNANNCLDYFERHLHLIKSIGYNNDQIRFVLEPLAEYLAGLYLVEKYGINETFWREFLVKIESKPKEEIKGFLLALRECCITKGSEAKVPSFVAEELGRLAGLNLEALKLEQLTRRIHRLINDLFVPDVEDRLRAAQEIGKIGSAARFVALSLLETLRDEDYRVRASTAEALGKLGDASTTVLLQLVAQLEDEDSDVRAQTVQALGNLYQVAKANLDFQTNNTNTDDSTLRNVRLGLVRLLNDRVSYVRGHTVDALGQLGDSSPEVLEGLFERLRHDNSNEHNSILNTLCDLGRSSPELQQLLLRYLTVDNHESNTRLRAAKVLGRLGNTSPEVLQALLQLIASDPDFTVLVSGARAFYDLAKALCTLPDDSPERVQILPEILQALEELFIHGNFYVAIEAERALNRLRNMCEGN